MAQMRNAKEAARKEMLPFQTQHLKKQVLTWWFYEALASYISMVYFLFPKKRWR